MGVLISWANLAEAAATNLTVDSEASGLGLRAVLTPQISDIWRSSTWGATTINLRADLGSAVAIRTIAIAAPRDGLLPRADASIRVTADASVLDGTGAYDSGVMSLGTPMSRFGLWGWAGTEISARYVRLSFTGSISDAYLQLGRLWIGPALITARNASYGHNAGVVDPGANARAALTGVRDVQRGTPYRQLKFPLGFLAEAEATQVETAALAAGSTGQVLVARLHTDVAGTGCFGVFSPPPIVTRSAHPFWSAEMSVEEDL